MIDASLTSHAIRSGLRSLGVHEATTIIIHASLSAFGNIEGGADVLCAEIRDVVGRYATIVMPGFTPQLIHPSVRLIKQPSPWMTEEPADAVPVFDKARTQVGRKIGKIAETFRKLRDTQRSSHPYTSFLANGPVASRIVQRHPLPYRLSTCSPLGVLYDCNALILLLGVSWQQCTALHLAEYMTAYRGRRFGKWLVPSPTGTSGYKSTTF
ncbi:AAC(3) family N-acetyltransferase [Rhizobium leguminosarum]|uniref:AAC(3) family N-acetyltransferase n=1 Tax=Rhizobium leguminosarum TaxID=384 RepID=UPI001C9677F8|nr:AAC(3) family N-acetyltransferase [Rhizobium leguminosarum]